MFKTIPGNHKFLVSLDKHFIAADDSECTPVINNNQVTLTMYGKEVTVCVEWLALLAHYECHLPVGLESRIWDVIFVNNSNKRFQYPLGKQLIFRHAITYKKKYRLISLFPRFAISREGEIIDTKTDEHIPVSFISKINNYPSVSIYDPCKGFFRTVHVHRLIALAWIPNNEPEFRCFVNHKNGNKLDFSVSNLEWCSFSENNIHALETGLRSDNIKVKVKNVETGEITEYYSICKMADSIGLPNRPTVEALNNRRVNNLILNKYEIRTETDNRPWFYDKLPEKNKPGRYIVTITSDKGVSVFNDTRDLIKHFKLWNISNNVYTLTKVLKDRQPDLKIDIVDQYKTLTIQAKNVLTGEIFEDNSITRLSNKTQVPRYDIKYSISEGSNKVRKNYVFRIKSLEEWPEIDFTKNQQECILVENHETGESYKVKSLREAERVTGLTKKAVKHHCENGNRLRNWSFKKLIEDACL